MKKVSKMSDAEKARITTLIEGIKDNVGSPIVARKSLDAVTGGILHGRTMANRDSLGDGIDGMFYIGKQAVYPVDSVVEYLKTKAMVA